MFYGVRVVRGPNWKWGDQDGGEGHVGTVIVPSNINESKSRTQMKLLFVAAMLSVIFCPGPSPYRR